jgi:hypothetical protein
VITDGPAGLPTAEQRSRSSTSAASSCPERARVLRPSSTTISTAGRAVGRGASLSPAQPVCARHEAGPRAAVQGVRRIRPNPRRWHRPRLASAGRLRRGTSDRLHHSTCSPAWRKPPPRSERESSMAHSLVGMAADSRRPLKEDASACTSIQRSSQTRPRFASDSVAKLPLVSASVLTTLVRRTIAAVIQSADVRVLPRRGMLLGLRGAASPVHIWRM